MRDSNLPLKPAWREEFDKKMAEMDQKVKAKRADNEKILKDLDETQKLRMDANTGVFGSILQSISDQGERLRVRNEMYLEAFAFANDLITILKAYAVPLRREYPDDFRKYAAEYPILIGEYEKQIEEERKLLEKDRDLLKTKLEITNLSSPKPAPKPPSPKSELHLKKVQEFKEAADKIRAMFPNDPKKADEFIEKLRSDLFEEEE